ncbi:MAG: sodium:proton antiporter [Chloroflexi bacterium]|nr:sodium:proton antiporter [Chloroflexota bacterium]
MPGEGTFRSVEFFTILLGAASILALISRRFGFPYTVALVLFGLGVAAFVPALAFEITPELVLVVLLPALVFEAAYQTDIDHLRHTGGGIALLAIPGVLISAGVVAVVIGFATGLDLELAFVIGAMVSATDPVAVIATFRRLGTPPALTTLVEGESLFNDGTAIVVFSIALGAVEGQVSIGDAIGGFTSTVLFSLVLGGITGFIASRVVARVNDHLIETTISLLLAYGTYVLADLLHQSGVIATVVAGITLGTYGRRIGMSERTQEALDTVWEFLAFILTALIFLLVGLAITPGGLIDAVVPIAWGIGAVLIGRALVIYGLLGGVGRLLGPARGTLERGWLHILFWSGLRGAVTVALALSLPADFPQRTLVQSVAFGITLFTLIAQGLTIGWVTRKALGTGPA